MTHLQCARSELTMKELVISSKLQVSKQTGADVDATELAGESLHQFHEIHAAKLIQILLETLIICARLILLQYVRVRKMCTMDNLPLLNCCRDTKCCRTTSCGEFCHYEIFYVDHSKEKSTFLQHILHQNTDLPNRRCRLLTIHICAVV